MSRCLGQVETLQFDRAAAFDFDDTAQSCAPVSDFRADRSQQPKRVVVSGRDIHRQKGFQVRNPVAQAALPVGAGGENDAFGVARQIGETHAAMPDSKEFAHCTLGPVHPQKTVGDVSVGVN